SSNNSVEGGSVRTRDNRTVSEKRKSWKQKRKGVLLAKQKAVNTISLALEETPAQREVQMLASAANRNSPAERIEMDIRAGLLDVPEEKYSFDKKSEDALPKKKKIIFHYSLG